LCPTIFSNIIFFDLPLVLLSSPQTGFFDPAGLTSNIDEETFRRYRAGEIKNGRVAMLAVIGYIVPEFYRFPGELMPGLAFKDIPNGIAAVNAIPSIFWMTTFFAIGMVDYLNSDNLGYHEIAPGPEMDEETMNTRRTNEVSNGRLAMLAFFELLRHDWQNTVQPGFDGFDRLITGLPFLYN
jgi:hypothetical protein